MSGTLAALVAALVCAAAGALVPWVVRSLPEPDQRPEPDDREPDDREPDDREPDDPEADDPEADGAPPAEEPPKPAYTDLGRRRGLLPGAVLASATGGALAGLVLGPGWPMLYAVVATPVCVALAYVDWHTRLLPSRLVLPATAALVLLALVEWAATGEHEQVLRAGLGLLVARSVFWVLWFVHSAGMGFGDVRLAALLGLVLGRVGWVELATGLYAGFLLFAVPGLLWALVRWDRSVLRRARPFGPFMVAGALLGLVVGPLLVG